MSDSTRKLLSSLAENPETRERFKRDPKGVMDEFAVPAAHQELILSGDKKKIAEATGVDDNTLQFVIL